MKKFLIAGNIVDTDEERMTLEDVTPAQVNAFIKNLEPNEEVEFEITSFGGSCTAGLAISNMIRQASIDGHKSTAYVMGIAASMASVIACACDNLKIDNNAFVMIHLPWTLAEGNANDLRKEADTLDKFRDALLAVYRTKFDVSDEILIAMMEEETWFLGSQADMFKLNCEVVFNEEPLKAAAFAKSMPKFNKIPKMIVDLMESNMEKEELKEIEKLEQPVAEEIVIEKVTETVETKTETETITKTPIVEEEPKEEVVVAEQVEESVPKAEVEKRVSGMQSKMAKQMDALKKDYEAKITEFNNQIKVLNDELENAKAETISIKDELEKSKKELSEMTSAFAEKTNALANLNANVNTPNEQINWKALKGKEFFDWYKKTH